jgi:hypothetical protein
MHHNPKRRVGVDLFETSAREKRSTFVKVVAGCLLAFIIAPPLAQAAVTTIKGSVKIKDSGGGAISASSIGAMGLFEAAGSSGAVDVRNFAGGGGVLGAADCTETTADGPANFVAVTDSIVTGIIITGTDATFTATAQAFANHALPLLQFRTTPDHPSEFIGLGNGLTITTELKITCTAGTNGRLIVVGQ